jgi:hypothetical protein
MKLDPAVRCAFHRPLVRGSSVLITWESTLVLHAAAPGGLPIEVHDRVANVLGWCNACVIIISIHFAVVLLIL